MVEDYENGGSPHNNKNSIWCYLYKYSTRGVPLVPETRPLMPSLVIMIIIDVAKVKSTDCSSGNFFLRKFRLFQFFYNQ